MFSHNTQLTIALNKLKNIISRSFLGWPVLNQKVYQNIVCYKLLREIKKKKNCSFAFATQRIVWEYESILVCIFNTWIISMLFFTMEKSIHEKTEVWRKYPVSNIDWQKYWKLYLHCPNTLIIYNSHFVSINSDYLKLYFSFQVSWYYSVSQLIDCDHAIIANQKLQYSYILHFII